MRAVEQETQRIASFARAPRLHTQDHDTQTVGDNARGGEGIERPSGKGLGHAEQTYD